MLNSSLVSTLSTKLVNEVRVGYKASKQVSWAPWYVGKDFLSNEKAEPGPDGKEAWDFIPKYNGIPYLPVSTLFPENVMKWNVNAGTSRFSNSPQYSFADTLRASQADVRAGRFVAPEEFHERVDPKG